MDTAFIGPQALGQKPAPKDTQQTDALRAAAQELEASFLAEMLKSAGMGKTSESFGGGAGEDQFASLLVREHARALVDAGGIGLSEAIFEALKERDNAVT
ncbi:MAG: rod-binding protein [Pseudomonadota bacterium]